MYDAVVLISNKTDQDWEKLENKLVGNDYECDVMGVTIRGNVCGFVEHVNIAAPFYIINENIGSPNILLKLTEILELNPNKTMLIAVHKAALKGIRRELPNLPYCIYQPFHHEDYYPIWADYLRPFIDAVASESNAVEALIKLRGFDNIYLAHRFRSELLTPFIPFHMACQTGDLAEWTTLLEQSRDLINIDLARKNIERLVTLFSPSTISIDRKSEFNKRLLTALAILIDVCKDDLESKRESLISAVQEFASCLENVVHCIEFGDVSECR